MFWRCLTASYISVFKTYCCVLLMVQCVVELHLVTCLTERMMNLLSQYNLVIHCWHWWATCRSLLSSSTTPHLSGQDVGSLSGSVWSSVGLLWVWLRGVSSVEHPHSLFLCQTSVIVIFDSLIPNWILSLPSVLADIVVTFDIKYFLQAVWCCVDLLKLFFLQFLTLYVTF